MQAVIRGNTVGAKTVLQFGSLAVCLPFLGLLSYGPELAFLKLATMFCVAFWSRRQDFLTQERAL